MTKAVREWVRKAEADHRAAERLASANDPLHDQVCFFSQQSAEKYLKAVIESFARTIPKTHDLDRLLNLLVADLPVLRGLRRSARPLSEFAVATRYPGVNATKRDSTSALRWAGRVRDACRTILGVQPPGGRQSP
jgi:HEPN domain-containing protein